MKNSILILSVGVTLLCAFLLMQKNREMADYRIRMAAADEARAASAARAEQEEKWTKNLQKRLRQAKPEPLEEIAATNAQPGVARARIGESKMFRDAMMKEALGAEAKIAVSRNVQQLFDAGLASRLQLNESQSESLRQLLTQRASILWDQMLVPMATGEFDAATMSSTGQAIKQEIDQNAAQIRELLGDDGYNTWQWFDKTQPERDEANDFTSAADKSGLTLTQDQQSQLLDLMTTERANFNFQYDIGDPSTLDFEHWFDNFTEEKIDAYQQDMEKLNNGIVQRASGLLTPEQTTQLNQFLAQQLFQSLVTIHNTQSLMAGNTP